VVESNEFKEAFDKVKALGTDATDEEIKAFLIGVDLSNQPDFSVVGEVVIPRSYVDGFVQSCFDNNPLMKIELEDKFINGTSKREPIGLLNERNVVT